MADRQAPGRSPRRRATRVVVGSIARIEHRLVGEAGYGQTVAVSIVRKVGLGVAVVIAIVLALALWRVVPVITGPVLPIGATPLRLATQTPNLDMGCATALLSPSRVATDGDELVLVLEATGDVVAVVWPSGFAAWRSDGRAVLADPWGRIVAVEGDVLDGLGGGMGQDDRFIICPFGL